MDPERSLKNMVRLRQHPFTTTPSPLCRDPDLQSSVELLNHRVRRLAGTLTSSNLPVCHSKVVTKRVSNLQMQFRFALESKKKIIIIINGRETVA